MDPFRTPGRDDVVETRLASLEAKSEETKTWRRLFTVSAALLLVGAAALAVRAASPSQGPCRDEVKTAPVGGPVGVSCAHPNHQASLSPYSYHKGDIVVECHCR